MFSFTIDVSPLPSVFAGDLDNFGRDIRSFREPLKRSIQQVLAPSFRNNFAVGGRPAWPQLSDETVKPKGDRILVRSGALERASGQLNLWTLTREEAFISQLPERVWYGIVHQEGGGRTPQREFLAIQPEDIDGIERVFEEWLRERLLARGF